MRCVACLQGDLHECRQEGNCDSSSGQLELADDSNLAVADNSGLSSGAENLTSNVDVVGDGSEAEEEVQEFRTYKDDSAIRDQQSTGRKRAAKMYPLDPEKDCEWRMKKNCGGGTFPIVGCLAGKQEARHHGPYKNTLNNEKGNVHRICHFCHNRWHTLNDPDYVWNATYDLHRPIAASSADIVENEAFWAGKKLVKAKD